MNQAARMRRKQKEIYFYGTPENDYLDSGLWKWLKYVRTKDEHDSVNPVKPIPMKDGVTKEYITTVLHFMLKYPELAIPKSRQIFMSWLAAIFWTWYARTAKHRKVVWQAEKEDKAAEMVSMGEDDFMSARMTFIEFNLRNKDDSLARWLMDPNIVTIDRDGFIAPGKGLKKNRLIYRNGSIIKGIPMGGNQVRQEVPSGFNSDESAFQQLFTASYNAVQPALQGGGRGYYMSSAGPGGFCDLVNDYDGFEDGAPPPTHLYGENKHLPRGMTFWRTRGDVPVLQVHYTADPDKDPQRDGAQWFKEASNRYVGGTQSAGWQQEMEIEWNAAGGSPVFGWASRVDLDLVVPTPRPEAAMHEMFIFGGFDWGASENAASLQVMGIDKKHRLYFLSEWHKRGATYKEAADAIKANPYWPKLQRTLVGDWSLWNKDQNRRGSNTSKARLFAQEGVHFIRGTRGADEMAVEIMRGHYWADIHNLKAQISLACPHLLDNVRRLRWKEHRSVISATTMPHPETLVGKDIDDWDAAAMGLVKFVGKDFRRPKVDMPYHSYRATRNRMDRRKKRAAMPRMTVGG